MAYVGLDWDSISSQEAQKRVSDIERQEGVRVMLYQTKHGYHAVLQYPCEVSTEENIRLRKKYWDDEKRLSVGIMRYKTTGRIEDLDVLFTRKNGHLRRPLP